MVINRAYRPVRICCVVWVITLLSSALVLFRRLRHYIAIDTHWHAISHRGQRAFLCFRMRLITAKVFSRGRMSIAVCVTTFFGLHGQLSDAAVLVGVVNTSKSPLLTREH